MITPNQNDLENLQKLNVSRETIERLQIYAELLQKWQKKINLISPDSLPFLWKRHFIDSLQLFSLHPQAAHWLDMGSGGGLPGLVIACCLAAEANLQKEKSIILVESNHKKAAFLRHVILELALPAQVLVARLEEALPEISSPDIITARALAPLSILLDYSYFLIKNQCIALFPKGRDFEAEIRSAYQKWKFGMKLHTSLTDVHAQIIEVSDVDFC